MGRVWLLRVLRRPPRGLNTSALVGWSMFWRIFWEQKVSSKPLTILLPPADPLLLCCSLSCSSLPYSGNSNWSLSARTMKPLLSSLACNLLITSGSRLKASAKSSSSNPLKMLLFSSCSPSSPLRPRSRPCSCWCWCWLWPDDLWLPARKNFCMQNIITRFMIRSISCKCMR